MARIHVEAAPGSISLRIVSSINTSTLELEIEAAVQLASDILDAAHDALAADTTEPVAV